MKHKRQSIIEEIDKYNNPYMEYLKENKEKYEAFSFNRGWDFAIEKILKEHK